MFNNSNNPGGGNPSSSNSGMGGGGDFGGSGMSGGFPGSGSGEDPMNSIFGGGNDMSAAARFGMGGGNDMMGMNAMGGMNSAMGGMGGMNSMGGMGMGNMPPGMSSRMDNMDMIALYRAKEKMAMMNARRAAFLGGGGDEKFGNMGSMGGGPSFMSDVNPIGFMGGTDFTGINAVA